MTCENGKYSSANANGMASADYTASLSSANVLNIAKEIKSEITSKLHTNVTYVHSATIFKGESILENYLKTKNHNFQQKFCLVETFSSASKYKTSCPAF